MWPVGSEPACRGGKESKGSEVEKRRRNDRKRKNDAHPKSRPNGTSIWKLGSVEDKEAVVITLIRGDANTIDTPNQSG